MKTTAEPATLRELAETTAALRGPVTILDDYGDVDKDVVLLGKKEPVEWTNHAKHAVTIVFNHGSPFKRKGPIVVAPGDTESSDEPTNHGRHKYTVVGCLGNNDPTVIIDG
jgi:hypothetical protein